MVPITRRFFVTRRYRYVKNNERAFSMVPQSKKLTHLMTCSYCGTRNGEGEHRCRRCGRKPGDSLTGGFTAPLTEGALAAQMHPVQAPAAPRLQLQTVPAHSGISRPAGQSPRAG